METLYCQCFCDFLDGMYYSSYLVSTVNEIFLAKKIKRFEATNEYEALVTIIHRLIVKLEDDYKRYLIDKNIFLIVNNKELIADLTLENRRLDLPPSINELYIKVYDTVRKNNITIIDDLEENLLNNTIMGCYNKFYKLATKLSLIVMNFQNVNEECYKRLSKNDMSIQDILHFIEFSNLSIDKRIEYVDTIKKIREDRRELKNELIFLNHFSRPLNKISNTINGLFNLEKSKDNYELYKYKQIFSTKGARDKLLKTL